MKTPRPSKGFTLIELLVVISIIAILATFAVPAVMQAMTRAQLLQAVANARQIHLATFQMATDRITTGDKKIGWPRDVEDIASVTALVQRMVDYKYLKAGDLRMFAAPGIQPFVGTTADGFSGDTNSAFNIYTVSESDDSSSLFISTRNYDGSTLALSETQPPFKQDGFVIGRKGGDVGMYKEGQADNAEDILFKTNAEVVPLAQ